MNYYILTPNTILNRGKYILAGPFKTIEDAQTMCISDGFKWGKTLIEYLSDDIANQLTKTK